jgi:hypothetical protein
MFISNVDFQHLTKITLNEQVGYTFSTNPPHALGRIGARQGLAKQALSIRYLAAHAHCLRIFKLIPHLGRYVSLANGRGRHPNGTAPQAPRPVILALAELAVKCERLEEIILAPVTSRQNLIIVKDVPWYLREDLVAEQAEAIFWMKTSSIQRWEWDRVWQT